MTPHDPIHVCWTIDCEATQEAIDDTALGIRSLRGFCDLLLANGCAGTLFVVPGDARAYPALLREVAGAGLQIGLHYHPQEEGYGDYCGAYTADEQYAMYRRAREQFADAVGFVPETFRTGNCSANDSTFPVTENLGFTSCSHSMPGRNLPGLRSNWVNAPLSVHSAHRANRLLEGDMNLVEVPVTTDPDSMLWSGGHPQDLRVELFDAKNHRYMIDKVLRREQARPPGLVRTLVVLTHNIFDYSDLADFRRQTLQQMIRDLGHLAEQKGIDLIPSTIGAAAKAHRRTAAGAGQEVH